MESVRNKQRAEVSNATPLANQALLCLKKENIAESYARIADEKITAGSQYFFTSFRSQVHSLFYNLIIRFNYRGFHFCLASIANGNPTLSV